MKKILISFLLTAATVASHGQNKEDNEGVSFGIRAGVNFQNINGKDFNGNKLQNTLIPGFHAGVTLDVPVVPDFYFQPGLLFSTKGCKFKNSDYKAHLNYLEVPLNFIYKPLVGSGHVLLGFGPYIAVGVGGNHSDGNNKAKVIYKNNVAITDKQFEPYYRPLDAGANFLFGYEFASHISMQLNAQLGLLNLQPNYAFAPSDQTIEKNTGFGVSLGYRF